MMKLRTFLVECVFYFSSLWPTRVHYALADILYYIIYYIAGYRRGVVRRNIAASFPEKSTVEQQKIVKGFYRFFCDYIVETCRLLTISEGEMRRRMRFENAEEVQETLRDHDFVFLLLGHYGNWEWVSSFPLWVDSGIHCAQLYRPLNDRSFDHLFMRLRTRFGAENIAKNEALRRILTLKKEGRKSVIGFISDQSPRRANIHDWVEFLHQDTPVFTGTERIAKKVDAAIYYADVRRERRGHYVCRMRRVTHSVRDYPDYEVTETYMRLLEQTIRRQPSLWLWSHKRWKHRREVAE